MLKKTEQTFINTKLTRKRWIEIFCKRNITKEFSGLNLRKLSYFLVPIWKQIF